MTDILYFKGIPIVQEDHGILYLDAEDFDTFENIEEIVTDVESDSRKIKTINMTKKAWDKYQSILRKRG